MKVGLPIVLASLSVVSGALAQSPKIVIAENFAPSAGFAIETDDAHVLTRAGCLEPLARVGFDGSLQAALAVSWTQTSPTTWEFKLRPNVKFQDGQALTAEAAASFLTGTLNAKTPARGFSPRLVKSIEAVGADMVRVTTVAASVLVPYIMASPNTGILSPAGRKDGAINPLGTCTGPFVITAVNGRQSLALKRNDAYWDGAAALATAEIRFLPDANTRATQVRTGEAHLARTVPVAALAQLRRGPGTAVTTIDTPRTSQMLINTKKPPLDNAKVRQALQAALDLKAIAASLYEGTVEPAIGPFAPAEPWAPKGAAPAAFDPAKARALLAAAGVAPGSLSLEILAYSEKIEFKDLAAIIQEQLKAVGVNVAIRLAAYAAIEPDMLAGKYDLALLSRSHLTDVADPQAFLTSDYSCKGGYNLSHYCDAAIDATLAKVASEPDAAKRHAIYADIARKLQAEAVNIFIIHERGADAYGPRVKNFAMHPLGHYVLTPRLTVE